ncbi:hypothetical protein [Streptomyces sp. H28]|uniref:hypothetical protein n=1 Tax=Streptomyces sp. H28 TaxID=2775865 RepID=UPI00178574E0|nr:hypothetical protein [Streptomyces sp. H28]
MTLTSLLMVLVSHRLGLRARMTAAAETKTLSLGDVHVVPGGQQPGAGHQAAYAAGS